MLAYFQPRKKSENADGYENECGIQSKRLKKIVKKMPSFGDGGALSSKLEEQEKKTSISPKNDKDETLFQLFDDGDNGDIDSAILNVSLEQFPSSSSTSRTGKTSKSSKLSGDFGSQSTLPLKNTNLLNTARVGNILESDRLRVNDNDSLSMLLHTGIGFGENTTATLSHIDVSDVPLTQGKPPLKVTNQTSSLTITTVSRNKYVQEMKAANLMKAAEDSLKPTTPYIAMQNVNNLVRNRMKGKLRHIKGATGCCRVERYAGPSKRFKTTTSLLEQVNSAKETAAKSSLKSSDSDSDC